MTFLQRTAYIFLAALMLFIACSDDLSVPTLSQDTETYPLITSSNVKNIIFFIGDGMGITEIASARIKTVGPNGKLYMDRMPVTGFSTTHSSDNIVTDSAASGTALATGMKTENGMIGMTPDGTSYQSILRAAQDKGMQTGVIATSTITHATPASFVAHVPERNDQAKIAEHLIMSNVNVLLGGGKHFFIPSTSEGSERTDSRNLLDEAKQRGYSFVETKEALALQRNGRVLGLFQYGPMTTQEPEPSIAEMTAKAVDLLKESQNGFFLMVEGSQIDWAGHDNDEQENYRQTLLFDMAVKEGLEFALQNRETLIVVTADHETGGMNIVRGGISGDDLTIRWIHGSHTGTPVPVFAFGPGAENFTGTLDNTDIPKIMARLLNISDFPRVVN
ncbi:alkaline phosphatase [candidate division KSB1 bacterium]